MACIFRRQVSSSPEVLLAIDEMIVMGVQADPELLKAEADAHHEAIGSICGPNGTTPRADWDGVNAALDRVFASVPESTVVDVYNSVSSITDSGVPAYLKSLVNGAGAEKACAVQPVRRRWIRTMACIFRRQASSALEL